MSDVQTFFQDLCVVGSTGYRLPPIIGDWTHLFLKDDEPSVKTGTHAKCVEAHANFMKGLKDLSAEIKRRNAGGERRRPFDKMDPLMFECSVSI